MKYFSLHSVLSVIFCALFSILGQAQVLNKPEAADNPNLPGNSSWTAACASEDFNEYFVNFTWSPPLVNNDNKFILELSDANGDYTNAVILDSVSDKNNVFDFNFSFALPEDTRGDGYTMRVRSTSPPITGPESDTFAMYYIGYKDPILISRDRSGTIPPGGTINSCGDEDIVLATHNVPNYENYDYKWYRNGQPLTEITSELTVNQEGVYSVEIDYGTSCSGSANTLSNSIEIVFGTPLNISIAAQSTTDICSGLSVDLEANVNDTNLTYTWYKDGAAITTPTLGDSTFTVDGATPNFDGDYYVTVYGPNSCLEQSNTITVTDAGYFEVMLDQGPDIALLPTQSTTINVSTTASNPTFQWFRNNVALTGETSNSLVVSQEGDYYVAVSQSGGCINNTKNSETATVAYPDSFAFTIDYLGSYSDCSSTEATLSLTRIDAIISGNPVDVTSQIENDFSYQWLLDGSPVSGETTFAIMLVNPSENGTYSLSGTLSTYTATSNDLNVVLGTGETVEITSTGTALCEGYSIILSTDRDLSSETFEWLQDGVVIDTSNSQIEATEPGDYQLVVQQGVCPLVSNTIQVVPFDDSAITIDVDSEFLFVAGTTITVTAEGAASYEWFDENNNSVGTGSTFGVTQPGTYLLVASTANCSVTRTFTAVLKDEFEVPNVITPNGDGVNDLWLLPNIYSGNPNVRVTIFNDAGVEIYRQTNYQNNWPESSMAFPKQNMIFYYTIKEMGSTVKQGTITVIR